MPVGFEALGASGQAVYDSLHQRRFADCVSAKNDRVAISEGDIDVVGEDRLKVAKPKSRETRKDHSPGHRNDPLRSSLAPLEAAELLDRSTGARRVRDGRSRVRCVNPIAFFLCRR